ncbi:hypothetical protein ACFSJW_00610 [Flavobacterium artemisiae]|uniref:DUF4251 domain-containing protein n=1 Tax=Flavobacterium artemisiae TaxID=2126556 RepID=A0ABW4HI63_9FLAO
MKNKFFWRLFLLFLPFLMQAQKDSINVEELNQRFMYSIFDVLVKNDRMFCIVVPQEFKLASRDYKIDTAYIYLENHKYLQQTYTSGKLKFKTLVNEKKTSFYIENLITKRKEKIVFMEPCEILFLGILYDPKNKNTGFVFRGKINDYEQDFSLRFARLRNKNMIVLNGSRPF